MCAANAKTTDLPAFSMCAIETSSLDVETPESRTFSGFGQRAAHEGRSPYRSENTRGSFLLEGRRCPVHRHCRDADARGCRRVRGGVTGATRAVAARDRDVELGIAPHAVLGNVQPCGLDVFLDPDAPDLVHHPEGPVRGREGED